MPDEYHISIEKLVYGGDGLGHADGNTVFVPFVLPGETVRATVESRKKKLAWAKPQEILTASASRTSPNCPHFGTCGGCNYQHMVYREQVAAKTDILRETLSRLGGVSWDAPIIEHTAEPYGYRNRAQWAERKSKPRALGYFLPRSSTVLPVDQCPVLSPLLAKTFGRLQDMARSSALPEQIEELEAFVDSADSKLALNVAFSAFPKPVAELNALFREALPELESLLIHDQKRDRFELRGPGYLFHEHGGFRFRVSHLAFFQVNRFLIDDLLQTIVGAAKGESALDLYAGVGFFTLPLARNFARVTAVDANLAATSDLKANAEAAKLGINSFNEHTEEFLKRYSEKPDLVVLDPPRSGLGTETAALLAQVGAPEIFYLSCDPSTLARDLAVLTQSGKQGGDVATRPKYEITELHLFDLFPQTFHIESFVRLRLM